MAVNILHQLDMGVNSFTPWVDCRPFVTQGVQTDCGDIASPVGVITWDFSNDWTVIEAELRNGTLPASTAAKLINLAVAAAAGASWQTGYDGVGAKASWATVSTSMAFVRLKYARTGGGVGDTLTVRWNQADRLGRQ